MTIDEFVNGILKESSIPTVSPKASDIVVSINKQVADFTSTLIKTNQEEKLFELLKKMPSALYFIKFNNDDDGDVETFKKCLESLANVDYDFYKTINHTHVFSKIFHQFSVKWAKHHTPFFTKSTLKVILGGSTVSHTVDTFIDQFLENADLNGEMAALIHQAYRTENGSIIMHDNIALKVCEYVTEKTLKSLKSDFLNSDIFYVSADRTPFNLKITPEQVFDQFLTDQDIANVCNHSHTVLAKYNALKRFFGRMPIKIETEFVKEVALDSYSKANRIGSLFKSLPTELIDKHANLALDVSEWTFIHFSKDKKLEMLDKVNIEQNMGLLAYHPTPSEVPLAKWREAIINCEISHKAFPSHLLVGDQKLDEDELLELIEKTNGGRNKIFNQIHKEFPNVVTESLLLKISKSGLQAKNHPVVVRFAAESKRNLERKTQINLLMNLAVEGDTSSMSTKIIELANKAMLDKKTLCKVLNSLIEQR